MRRAARSPQARPHELDLDRQAVVAAQEPVQPPPERRSLLLRKRRDRARRAVEGGEISRGDDDLVREFLLARRLEQRAVEGAAPGVDVRLEVAARLLVRLAQ